MHHPVVWIGLFGRVILVAVRPAIEGLRPAVIRLQSRNSSRSLNSLILSFGAAERACNAPSTAGIRVDDLRDLTDLAGLLRPWQRTR